MKLLLASMLAFPAIISLALSFVGSTDEPTEVRTGGSVSSLVAIANGDVSVRTTSEIAHVANSRAGSGYVGAPAIQIERGSPKTAESSQDPRELAAMAAREFNVDASWMRRVIACESTWNTEAIGDQGRSVGIAQFQAATFLGYSRISGLGYTLADYGDPAAQLRVMAWAFANGRAGAWTCAY